MFMSVKKKSKNKKTTTDEFSRKLVAKTLSAVILFRA